MLNAKNPHHAACNSFIKKVQGKKIQNVVTSDFSIYFACSLLASDDPKKAKEYADLLYGTFQLCDNNTNSGDWREISSLYTDIPMEHAIEASIMAQNGIKSVFSTNACFTKLNISVTHPKDV